MSKPQPNLRTAAARAFVESLDQLQTILAEETPTSDPQPQKLDMKVWEEAAADLDEFFGDVQ
ncbi:hypothetical protein IQ258_15210, partial [Coleofasciculus sp. LEGE 07081]